MFKNQLFLPICQIFNNQNFAPQDSTQALANSIAEEIKSSKASQGGAKFILDQWLVFQGLAIEDIEALHRQASSKLDANLLLKWEDSYTTNSMGLLLAIPLSGMGFFGGFGLSILTGPFAILALVPFSFGGAFFGLIAGSAIGSQTHESLDYVPTVSTVYSQVIIKMLCQKQLQASQQAQ